MLTLDQDAALEAGSGPHEGHEVGCVDGAPAVLGGLDVYLHVDTDDQRAALGTIANDLDHTTNHDSTAADAGEADSADSGNGDEQDGPQPAAA